MNHQIDLSSATPRAVIERSAAMHPSLFMAGLLHAATVHMQAASSMRGARSGADKVALRLAQSAADAANMVELELPETAASDIMAAGMDTWITAFNIAARLQLIPPATRADIVNRSDVVKGEAH